jgi:hypothetical protein
MESKYTDQILAIFRWKVQILAIFRWKVQAIVRDNNVFFIAKIVITSFVTHFDVLKPPIGRLLTRFSKTTSNKASLLEFYFDRMIFRRDLTESDYSYFT